MNRIIVFGAGEIGRRLLSYKPKDDVEVLFVCDNDKSLWGKSICGYTVESPDRVGDTEFDSLILAFLNGVALNQVMDELIEKKVPREKMVFTYEPAAWGILSYPVDLFFDIPRKPLKPFKKGPAEIYMDYTGETAKSHERRQKEGFFEKYCKGEGLDIGYGADIIVPGCSGWDLQNGDAQLLEGVEDESFDFVYSSHCLEHVCDVRVALKNWFRVVRPGGYLIVAIPHRDLYEKKLTLPSRWNADHKHMFLIGRSEAPDTLDIVEEVKQSLTKYDIKYVKACDYGHTITDPMVHSDGEFQIEMVIQKI